MGHTGSVLFRSGRSPRYPAGKFHSRFARSSHISRGSNCMAAAAVSMIAAANAAAPGPVAANARLAIVLRLLGAIAFSRWALRFLVQTVEQAITCLGRQWADA
jgi:hypothetical protein